MFFKMILAIVPQSACRTSQSFALLGILMMLLTDMSVQSVISLIRFPADFASMIFLFNVVMLHLNMVSHASRPGE